MEFLLLAFFGFCQQITGDSEESDSHRLLGSSWCSGFGCGG